MSEQEYRKYNSDVDMEIRNIRLAKDAEIKGDNFVKLTVVTTSKNDNDEDMWWDVIPIDALAAQAGFLKKGDVLTITGFPTMRRYGDDNEKVGLSLKNARLHLPLDLFMTLKERGFEPGAAAGKKTGGGKKAPAGKGRPAPAKRPVQDLDEDLDEQE